jgi:hypothetical protein
MHNDSGAKKTGQEQEIAPVFLLFSSCFPPVSAASADGTGPETEGTDSR